MYDPFCYVKNQQDGPGLYNCPDFFLDRKFFWEMFVLSKQKHA